MSAKSRLFPAGIVVWAAWLLGAPQSANAPAVSLYGPAAPPAPLEDRAIRESSGIVASRRNPGLYWTHNDSGAAPVVYAFDRQGRSRGVWHVPGAEARDWEDIAAGPGPSPGRGYLYIADIGDNLRGRTAVTVWRVEEPAVPAGSGLDSRFESSPAAPIRLRYPGAPHNAEALLVHPRTGDLYIVTKAQGDDPETLVYKAAASFPGDTVTMKRIASLRFPDESRVTLLTGRITGGDISPDGRRVILCGYFRGYEAELPPAASAFDAIWKRPWGLVDLGARTQGEGVCYRLDGQALLATSEGSPCLLFEALRLTARRHGASPP